MSSVSIKHLLRLALPPGSRLLTGDPETRITWVRRTRVQPPAFLNLDPGEFALLSMETMHMVDERLTLVRVVEALAQVKVGAIGVQGPTDPAGVDRAHDLNVPLIALPHDVSLMAIERAVTRVLIERETQIEMRGHEIAGKLAEVAAENRGLEAILHAVTDTTGKIAIVYDESGEPLAHTAVSEVPSLPVQEVEQSLNGRGSGTVSRLGYTVPLIVEGKRAGYLTLVNGGQFDDLDRVTVERGAMVCAMELAKQKAIVDAENRARGDWVQQWLAGNPEDDRRLAHGARQAGIDLETTYMVALFGCDDPEACARALDLLRHELESRKIDGIVGQGPPGALVFYPMTAMQRIVQVIDAIRDDLSVRLGKPVCCGVGRPAQGLDGLRHSYRQAERAMQMGAQLCDGGCTIYFGDLDLYRLLLSVEDRQELRRFYEESLGPVVAYDSRHDGELTRTMEAFFANNGNLARTADALCVHRNTLSYRLGRVADITGLDLEDAETRLMLHLALKVGRVLEAIT